MELFIVCGVIIAVCVILLMGGNYMEKRWRRKHPPDDGTSEVRFDDENTGS